MTSIDVIRNLKNNVAPLGCLKFEVPDGSICRLRPVRVTIEDAAKISRWRCDNYDSFFTSIKPSEKDVLAWLKGYQHDYSDIMFFIDMPSAFSVGQMALYHVDPDKRTAEFGRVIRGEMGSPKGIITLAAKTLLEWAFRELGLEQINLEVFSDNKPAVSLYQRLGFQIVNTVLFTKIINESGIEQWLWVTEKKRNNVLPQQQDRQVTIMVLYNKR
ncbi:MAG: GNAT family N-acetyltransferase [Thermodesulfobacteriota bacterium]